MLGGFGKPSQADAETVRSLRPKGTEKAKADDHEMLRTSKAEELFGGTEEVQQSKASYVNKALPKHFACANCHSPSHAYTKPQRVTAGTGSKKVTICDKIQSTMKEIDRLRALPDAEPDLDPEAMIITCDAKGCDMPLYGLYWMCVKCNDAPNEDDHEFCDECAHKPQHNHGNAFHRFVAMHRSETRLRDERSDMKKTGGDDVEMGDAGGPTAETEKTGAADNDDRMVD